MAWRSASLHDVCARRAGLDAGWPGSASTARELLALVSHAVDLGSLMLLRSVSTVLVDDGGHVAVTIGLEEVEMLAAPLTQGGSLMASSGTVPQLDRIASTTSLLVHDLTAHGKSIEKASR